MYSILLLIFIPFLPRGYLHLTTRSMSSANISPQRLWSLMNPFVTPVTLHVPHILLTSSCSSTVSLGDPSHACSRSTKFNCSWASTLKHHIYRALSMKPYYCCFWSATFSHGFVLRPTTLNFKGFYQPIFFLPWFHFSPNVYISFRTTSLCSDMWTLFYILECNLLPRHASIVKKRSLE